MILQPGSFRVGEFRRSIPDWVKVAVTLIYAKRFGLPNDLASAIDIARSLQYDHRPPLNARPYDTEAGDFIPPQNDPKHIEAIDTAEHLERTTGRKAGAEKTVTTRNSDVGEAARTKGIRASDALHKAALASKAGQYHLAAEILATTRPRKKPKRKIPSRPFGSGRRPFNSKKFGGRA